MRIDVNCFLGHYPYRRLVGGSPMALLEAMDRNGIDQGWVSNLPAVFWKDPTEGNAVVYSAAAAQPRFRPVPAVHPGLANWEGVVAEAADAGAPCIRADPTFYGIEPGGGAMQSLAAACGARGLPILLAVRLEDGRQRHPNDAARELLASDIRTLLRSDQGVRLLITHADRDCVEQVHFGSTPSEAARILWDISWIWGPPEDHLEQVVRAVGADRFCFGTGAPLRLPETSVAKLELASFNATVRVAIDRGNVERWLVPPT